MVNIPFSKVSPKLQISFEFDSRRSCFIIQFQLMNGKTYQVTFVKSKNRKINIKEITYTKKKQKDKIDNKPIIEG